MLCLAGTAIAAPVPASSANAQQAAAKLRKLQAEISRLRSQETAELKRKHRVQADLARLERRIGRLSRELQDLARRERDLAARRKTLQGQTAAARGAADQAQRELSAALRAAFVLGREPQVKLALQGDDPSTVARLLGYYGYYSQARSEHLHKLTATIARYQNLETELATTSHALEKTRAARQSSLAELEKTRRDREAVLAHLSRDIAGKHTRAAALEHDAARLERLIDSVSRDLADIPAGLLEDADFGRLQGRLPWPVPGHIVNRFGAARADGQLTWEAVRIAAPEGTPVHAIAYGRVAYAGWLPYYGLVLMIDHGDGYLTVYGHNEALYRQVGDWVRAGEMLATVGTSGGQTKPILYFQIRHRDHPLNPQHWCIHGRPPLH